MKKDKRIETARKKALEEMDYILETYSAPDFVEIVGKMGGDVITMRYYDNGMVVER